MPYGGNEQLSPTGLARFQQAATQRPGYISSADRRLIDQGVRTGGGYIQINDQVLVDEPEKYIELSDAGKAYLAWRGTDPKLAGIEAEQAQVRATQKEYLARAAGERNLELLQKEMARGVMSSEEYNKKQQEILQNFNNSKAPSPIDYLSSAQDKDDPIMQETRYKSHVKTTMGNMFGDSMPPEIADAVSGMTQRDKDGQLVNPIFVELVKGKVKEMGQAAMSKQNVVKMQLDSIDKQFETIESPTAQQNLGRIRKRNQILAANGLPMEDEPEETQASGHWYTLGYPTGGGPQSVADMFTAEAQRNLQQDETPQSAKIFDAPAQKPIPIKTNADIRRALIEAKRQGLKSIQYIGPDGVTRPAKVQ